MTGHPIVLCGTTADGRLVNLARGRRYRLTDGREAEITALQLGTGRHGGSTTTVRYHWPGASGSEGAGFMPCERFCALVAEPLDAPPSGPENVGLPATAGGSAA